jgi:hypothetical protein
VTNDLKKSCEVYLEWRLLNSEGDIILEGAETSAISPCCALKLTEVDISEIIKDQSSIKNTIIFYILYQKDKENRLIHRGFRLFDAPKFFKLHDPEIVDNWEDIPGDRDIKQLFRLNLKASKIALYVNLSSDLVDFIASDNYFSLEPNEKYTIDIEVLRTVKNNTKYSKHEIINSFKIRSLFDIIKQN